MKHETLEALFGDGRQLVIRFGAGTPASDIDLLIVSGEVVEHEQVQVGRLDVTIIPLIEAIYRARRLDPLVSEPLLKGEEIVSNPSISSSLHKSLCQPAQTDDLMTHNLLEAMRCRLAAESFFQRLNAHSPLGEMAALMAGNLAWACSYVLAAQLYGVSNNPTAVSFEGLMALEGGTTLSNIRALAREWRQPGVELKISEVGCLRTQVDSLFLGRDFGPERNLD